MSAPMKNVGRGLIQRFMSFRRCSVLKTGLTYARYSTLKSSVSDILKSSVENLEKPTIAQGWVKSIRSYKEIIFLHITDGTTYEPLQIVIDKNKINDIDVTYGCCVSVKGQAIKSQGKNQNVEFLAESMDVIGPCDPIEFPFKQRKLHTLEYERIFPHLRAKTKSHSSLLRVRNQATMAIHKYFQENGYCFIHTPILTTNDCEGAGETFQIEPVKDLADGKENADGETYKNFFGEPTFLTVSGQLHLEVITGAFQKVYNFGPTFRADRSKTRHHLSEFYMVEAEISFLDNLDELMNVMEDLVKAVTRDIKQHSGEDINYLQDKKHEAIIEKMLNCDFERLSYTDAIKILLNNANRFTSKLKWGDDLSKEHEKFLTKEVEKPVFITDFPALLKPFYARRNEDDNTVAAVDLLVPEVGELIGGSVREERLKVIEDKLQSLNLLDTYQWYLDLRRYGTSPHGGFGLGFERYLQFLLGISNIKDIIPFPRSIGNCKL
ncbi:hypothetical protein SNE40_016166 [Patella caerulea]|uniref:asparagine--tRNA ligase n=1 Tax=Patella caerulea TaxID=87958 RepID=A0AAN8J8C8_PATCE